MQEIMRRVTFATVLAVAVGGAMTLMSSAMLSDPQWRAGLQIIGGIVAVLAGIASAVLAWRWWSHDLTARPTDSDVLRVTSPRDLSP